MPSKVSPEEVIEFIRTAVADGYELVDSTFTLERGIEEDRSEPSEWTKWRATGAKDVKLRLHFAKQPPAGDSQKPDPA